MARVVNIGALLPEDIEFHVPGAKGGDALVVTAPGDAPFNLVARIAAAFDAAAGGSIQTLAAEAEGDTEAIKQLAADTLEHLEELDALVLELLRIRDPDLGQSPFGIFGVQAFVGELLKQYNLMSRGTQGETPTRGSSPTRTGSRKRAKTQST